MLSGKEGPADLRRDGLMTGNSRRNWLQVEQDKQIWHNLEEAVDERGLLEEDEEEEAITRQFSEKAFEKPKAMTCKISWYTTLYVAKVGFHQSCFCHTLNIVIIVTSVSVITFFQMLNAWTLTKTEKTKVKSTTLI